MKYKVGDKVRIKTGLREGFADSPVWVAPRMAEAAGTVFVVESTKETVNGNVYVLKDSPFLWHESICEPVNPDVCPKPTWRIIIEGDENTCHAKYITGKKVIREATAKRYHKDKHDPGIAACAMIGKMFPDGVSAQPEPPKYFTGRAVCIETCVGGLTVGKIYDFSERNGCGVSDDGHNIIGLPAKNIEDINNRFARTKFIEIKE